MTLLLQSAPLLVLLGLLLSGRVGPLPAVVAALAASLPAAFVSLPAGASFAGFLVEEALRGLFLALQPIGVVLGGLLFHAAVEHRNAGAAPTTATPRAIFTATLLMGVFMESVTGFAVGAVFALAALRGMGIGGAPAAALALLSLCLIPWGGLGPGTLLGAALVGAPAQEIAAITALPNAAWVLLLGPVCWQLCAAAGLPVPGTERLRQMAMLATMAAILVVGHGVLPFEVLGILASGVPLVVALWLADPPRDAAAWRRAARAIWPYALLTVALLAARAVPNPPALQPYPALPSLPLPHVAVVLLLISAALLVLRGDRGARAGGRGGAWRRGSLCRACAGPRRGHGDGQQCRIERGADAGAEGARPRGGDAAAARTRRAQLRRCGGGRHVLRRHRADLRVARGRHAAAAGLAAAAAIHARGGSGGLGGRAPARLMPGLRAASREDTLRSKQRLRRGKP